jgi:hypothetical protein
VKLNPKKKPSENSPRALQFGCGCIYGSNFPFRTFVLVRVSTRLSMSRFRHAGEADRRGEPEERPRQNGSAVKPLQISVVVQFEAPELALEPTRALAPLL